MHWNPRIAFAAMGVLLPLAVLGASAEPPAAAAQPLIHLSSAQAEAAGVATASAIGAASASDVRAPSGLRLSGQVVTPGDNSSVMLSAVAGQVESVLVQVGATVRAGQPLVRLFSTELAAMQREYLHARAADDIAKSRLERDELLLADGIISESRARETRAARQMALATLQENRGMLLLAGYSKADIEALSPESLSSSVLVRARVDAIVLSQGVAVGQRVEPGTELFRLAQGGRLWLDLHASAQQAGGLAVGDGVSVPGCTGSGRIIAVGAQLDAASQTTSVRAEMPDATRCLRVNQYVEADVRQASVPTGAVGLPSGAVVRNGDRDFVFVREGAGFRPVAVRVARADGDRVWVHGGVVPPGATVASRGLVALKGAWLGLGPQPEQGGSN